MQVSGNPVARARVALRARSAARGEGAFFARAETDWQGRFVLDDVPSAEEAWLEVEALYYLGGRGPPFSIPAGEDLQVRTVMLHFGATLHGEVMDGEGLRLPHAEVAFALRGAADGNPAASSRTDSKGTFLLSGLAPGEYAIEVRIDGSIAASFAGLWVQADAPTVQIQLRLDGSSLTFPEEQDLQQFRVYRAEKIVDIGSRRIESIDEIQAYVDDMIASAWWRSEFAGIEAIEVRMGKEETDLARGGADLFWDEAEDSWEAGASGHIELPPWAWTELVVLHEVAHVLSPGSKHGPLFARSFHHLVARKLGESAASELALAYAAEGVSW